MASDYRKIMVDLIKKSGGIVGGDFVTKAGIMQLNNHDGLTTKAKSLFKHFNINQEQSSFLQLSEFCSRITYLSFKDSPDGNIEYHNKMINEYGHLSPYSLPTPCILIAGCTIEGLLEFVAHKEAVIARLTSSMTKAMDNPLFVLSNGIEYDYLIEMQKLRNDYADMLDKLPTELKNRLYPSNKATAFVIGMNIKDWHKTFIGRISNHGVEQEMVDLCVSICELLRKTYPNIILTPNEYFNMNNNTKYKVDTNNAK